MRTIFLVFFLALVGSVIGQNITVSGKVADEKSGEDMMFATVYVEGTSAGVTTNEYGFFSLSFDPSKISGDKFTLVISYIGYAPKKISLDKGKSHKINIDLAEDQNTLDAFTVTEERTKMDEELNSSQMSIIRVPMKQIRYLPSLGGEVDIIKVMQLMPGVARGTEGTTGMFVRGGDADQNLVLLDEATVYNVGHLFGFFSVFNSDAIKDMTMIKGGFPAHYGGRLSSILDIRMKEGNVNEFHGQGGVGLLSSRLTLEGPIIKDKMSFLLSGRRTYIDQVFKLVGQTIPYYFYDLNAKLNYKFSDKDRLFYSAYLGNDVLKYDEQIEDRDSVTGQPDTTNLFDFGFTLGNITNTLRWNHIYNDKLFSNVSFITTSFKYDIRGSYLDNNLLIKSRIQDFGLKADWQLYQKEELTFRFGTHVIQHQFRPNIISTAGVISEFLGSREGDRINFQELALYGNAEYDLIPYVLKLKGGLRISGAVVPGDFYVAPEPRVAAKYSLSEHDALKVSYSRMRQYMHRVSSSTVALPTDLWYPVTKTIKPQWSDQVAAGYNRVFRKLKTSLSIEGYYKWMNNLIEYREGANLVLNDDFETELVQGKGDAYGVEVLFRRESGRWYGWLGYTLSWATRDFDDLNGGRRYFAKYDRRNDVSLVLNYEINKRLHISGVWVFANGSRFTAQVGQYLQPNPSLTGIDIVPIYTERNAVSMSPSHRLDLNLVWKSRQKKKDSEEDRRYKWEWHFGCYNFYNRATPYRIEIVPNDSGIGYKYMQPGLFGFLPNVAFNFQF